MLPNQSLSDLTANILIALSDVFNTYLPDVILVQGDTTTAMAGALSGFYRKIKVAHVEAGLRSNDIYSPFPEEVNRKIIGTIAHYHFAPTQLAKENLIKENHTNNIHVTGNTVIDALLWGVEKVRENVLFKNTFAFLNEGHRFVLVTAHRRESFGKPFESICKALLKIARKDEALKIVYPVHLNPNVREIVMKTLNGQSNIHLIEPVDYPTLLWLMDRCYFVITDSGGIQEEAPSLGKPVLVLRDVTERQEGIDAGTAILVGTTEEKVISAAEDLLYSRQIYDRMARASNPYGDGSASSKIISYLINTDE
jgi:UDP-N-acetylglucosamine 2-epimerase (non-hydrolysing)